MSNPDFIRKRDKSYEGEFTVKQKRKISRHYANIHFLGHYLLLHKDRVKYHAQRVAGEERLMKRHGINPKVAGSAYEFDMLMEKLYGKD